MSYQIVYGSEKKPPEHPGKHSLRTSLAAGILLIVLVGTLRFTGIGTMLWQKLIPGDPEVTTAAFQNMTEYLRNGRSISDAVVVFCETVIEGAQLG